MKIKDIKSYKAETKLEKAVKRIIINQVEKDYVDQFFRDLRYGGCQSGLIGELIYYSETSKFYKRYKEDINILLAETLKECGAAHPIELFGDKWCNDDPLVLEDSNQNLLAWFAFEEITHRIALDLGLDV